MLFRVLDGSVDKLEIDSEMRSGGYCTTCYYEYDVFSIELEVNGIQETIYLGEYPDITYSDLMKFVLNGLDVFATVTGKAFIVMLQQYVERFDEIADKDFFNYESSLYYMLVGEDLYI